MRLSPHFSLAELTVTSTGLPNDPPPEDIERLRRLCVEVLEPWRNHVGPLKPTSGYRSLVVNKEVGGDTDSAHMDGNAADVKALTVTQTYAWSELVDLIRAGLPVRQAILYPGAQIHVAYGTTPSPNGQLLVKDEDAPSGFRAWREP